MIASAKRIDQLNARVEQIITDIRGSGHPSAAAIADELASLTMLDSAELIADEFLHQDDK